jgi:SAM-dependent methyltransferase
MKDGSRKLPDLYGELAGWFHLLTAPEDYAEEAEFYEKTIRASCSHPPETILELGSGGGNNALYFKKHFKLTLVDLSPEMLRISQTINQECEHLQGDMRTVRLGKQFDAVFIHDAISYLTTENDLCHAIQTACFHCQSGGAVLLCPDYTAETFTPGTEHGGHDKGKRGLRYLSWTRDEKPEDTTYVMDMVYLLREGEDVQCRLDCHVLGLFSETTWLRLLKETGFSGRKITHAWSDSKSEVGSSMFVGIKRE